jgi:hypothetical protein
VSTILIFAISAYAQVSFEIQGGLNIANLSNPGNLVPGAVWSSRIGFVGSASTTFKLTDILLISPGMRFVQKGTKSEWAGSPVGQVRSTLTNNYLELPVYLKMEITELPTQLSIVGGPAFSYLLSSRLEGTTQMFGFESFDVKADYKSYDASIDLGFSVQTPLVNNIALLATGIYSYGFIKIDERQSDEQTRDFRFTIGASYSLKE